MPQNLPVLNGRFLLQHKLGEGGMAAVWRAYDTRLQVWRAVKLLLPDFVKRGKIRKRFESEAQAMALLEHPNIVRVYDVGSDDKQSWIVMELCDGGSMEAWIEQHGPLPPRLAVDVALQVAAGIHAAHEHGVVHRDIKPQNVLITSQGTCKVTDFGIAHHEDQSLTRTGTVMGTLGYMAPEQRSDSKKVDRRTDVYAVGATLFTLLTGRIEMDLFAAGQDPSKLEGVAPALIPVLTHATAYHREERPASMRELGKALGEARSKLPPIPKGTPSLAPARVERPPVPSVVEQALAQASAANTTAVPPLPGETLAPAYDLFDGASIPPSLRSAAREKAAAAKAAAPAAGAPNRPDSAAQDTSFPDDTPAADPRRKPSALPWVPSPERRREEKPVDFESLYVKGSDAKLEPIDIDAPAQATPKTPPPKTPAPKTPPPQPAPAALVTERPQRDGSYDKDDEEKDPGKSAGRGLDAPWAVKEGWRFLMQILGGLLSYASSPIQYMLWPLVALFAIAMIGSLQGASHVVSAQTATTTNYNVFTTTLDRSAPELIDELSFAGANRQVLEAHYARYKEATTPEEERAAALALTKVMEETIVRLDETTDPREIAIRKSLQGRIQTLTRQRGEYIDAEKVWVESTETTTGKLAVRLGLAGRPIGSGE